MCSVTDTSYSTVKNIDRQTKKPAEEIFVPCKRFDEVFPEADREDEDELQKLQEEATTKQKKEEARVEKKKKNKRSRQQKEVNITITPQAPISPSLFQGELTEEMLRADPSKDRLYKLKTNFTNIMTKSPSKIQIFVRN